MIGYKKLKFWLLFWVVFNIKYVIIINIGCVNSFMVRLDMVRFRNRIFMFSVRDEDFESVGMMSKFLIIVMREDMIFIK